MKLQAPVEIQTIFSVLSESESSGIGSAVLFIWYDEVQLTHEPITTEASSFEIMPLATAYVYVKWGRFLNMSANQ